MSEQQPEALAARLRAVVGEIRRKPYPISDLIPLLTQAADGLSRLQAEADFHRADANRVSGMLLEAQRQVERLQAAGGQGVEHLFLLHTGQIDSSGEQDEWETEADSGQRVDEFCAKHPGQTVKLYANPPAAAALVPLTDADFLSAVRDTVARSLEKPGVPVKINPLVVAEMRKFMRDEPSAFDRLPYGDVKGIADGINGLTVGGDGAQG